MRPNAAPIARTGARTPAGRPLRLVDLELDLEVFAGPFDLLLTLILREEVDLLEVDLADVVISYIDYLESRGELDLEAATEFLVLITSLLELKSRLMLPGEEIDEFELDSGDAATELLERLLDAHRYRTAAEHLGSLLRDQAGYRFRSAPLPQALRRAAMPEAVAVYDPNRLARAIGGMLVLPPEVDLRHITTPKVTVAERLTYLRKLLRRGAFNFDEAVVGADRMTVAVTVYSLLELYKQGELTWLQEEPFGEIRVQAAAAPAEIKVHAAAAPGEIKVHAAAAPGEIKVHAAAAPGEIKVHAAAAPAEIKVHADAAPGGIEIPAAAPGEIAIHAAARDEIKVRAVARPASLEHSA